jgi:hypothetical protein
VTETNTALLMLLQLHLPIRVCKKFLLLYRDLLANLPNYTTQIRLHLQAKLRVVFADLSPHFLSPIHLSHARAW